MKRSEIWQAITHQMCLEIVLYIKDGTLKPPPLRILITGSDDNLVAEFEMEFDATGKPRSTPLSPDIPLTSVLPITYTVVDSAGKEMEAVFSEELVRTLRQVS